MRKFIATLTLALAAAGCSGGGTGPSVASAPALSPQLARCPALAPLGNPALARSAPVALPSAPFAALLAADANNLAYLRPDGTTGCTDVRLLGAVDNIAALQDDRFLAFAWSGHEAGGFRTDGHRLIDRAAGTVTETGGMPVFSPSGQHFAAAYQSESAFAGLEGFAVWRSMPTGPMLVATIDDLPQMLDWRVDKWSGESCVDLSGVPFAMVPVGTKNFAGVARERYAARQAGTGWQVRQGSC